MRCTCASPTFSQLNARRSHSSPRPRIPRPIYWPMHVRARRSTRLAAFWSSGAGGFMLPAARGWLVGGSKTVCRSKRPRNSQDSRNLLTTRGAWRQCGHGLANLSRGRIGTPEFGIVDGHVERAPPFPIVSALCADIGLFLTAANGGGRESIANRNGRTPRSTGRAALIGMAAA